MQQELVRMVSDRTGLSEDKARTAVDTVVGYLKDQLPAPIANQLDNVTGSASGGGASGGAGRGNISDMATGLGSKLTGDR